MSNTIFLTLFDNIFLNFISPFLAIYGFYKLFEFNKIKFFYTGFFVGILWFYWVSFSLIYYNLSFLIPLEILIFGIVYGLIFLICGAFKNKLIRAILLLSISYFYPFNFNWLNLELTLLSGIFEPSLRGLGSVFCFILFFYYLKKYKYLASIFLLFALQIEEKEPNFLPFKTDITNTQISQFIKWDPAYKDLHINEALKMIDDSIKNGYKFVILPENAFVVYLNLEDELIDVLKEKSNKITILTGALTYEKDFQYNSSYLFKDGAISRFDKFELVPFGEEIPLPKFLTNIINDIFFDGAMDFKKAKSYSEYEVDTILIRNAICYEATRAKTYEGSPKFIVAISNNGWFTPSTEPNLQRMLIKYYSTKHGTTIYHSANGSKSEVITPKRLWIKEFLGFIKI
ncbi:apolipoprotein N-acyltransferase [Campylobacter blaseri]|nr:apolipoprotein N-acyltransferase [Campylobacter blaseri]